MISRDDLPETPDWQPERHACPFDPCFVCDPHEGGGTYPPNVPPNIELGSE